MSNHSHGFWWVSFGGMMTVVGWSPTNNDNLRSYQEECGMDTYIAPEGLIRAYCERSGVEWWDFIADRALSARIIMRVGTRCD
jgi:hypothetical protein